VDALFVVIVCAFFVLCGFYLVACDRLWARCGVLDYAISLLVTAGLLVYLAVALLRPEKFW